MNSFLWYLLEANLILIVLFFAFQLTKKSLSFQLQRWFLLTMPVAAYGMVFIKSILPGDAIVTMAIVEIDPVVVNGIGGVKTSWWANISLTDLYWLGVVVALIFSVFRICKVFYTMYVNKKSKEEGFTIVEVDKEDSFSFFNFIQLRTDLEEDGKQLVLEHEKIHAQKYHSADVLFLELFHATSWFNPLFILLKKELNNLHEFEVDQIMYQRHKGKYMKFLLAYSLGVNSPKHILTNQFSNSLTIKKRLENMKTKRQKRWSALLTIPTMVIGLSMISWTGVPNVQTARDADQNGITAKQIEEKPDVMPQFPGGEQEMFKFFQEKIIYPLKAKQDNIEGVVYMQFVVERTGALSEFNVVKGAHQMLDREAMRVTKLMPNWTPGEKDGKKVAVRFTLPISFKL